MSEAEKGSDSAPDLIKPDEPGDNGLFVHVFGRTDVGLVRDHNEDNFLVADLSMGNRSIKPEVRNHRIGPKGSLFAVCDGMGGAAAGEVASQIAVDTIYEMMQRSEPPGDDEELARRLEMAIVEAGLRIFTAAKLDRKRRGMGTTVTAAVMIGPRIVIGQVGDSRAYVLRDDKLIQVTKDQSLVQQLLDAKQLTVEEAKSFDKSNIILQALGTSEDVLVDVTSAVLRKDDVLLMCSDGLSGVVEEDEIKRVLLEYKDPMEACRKLTDMACAGGGHDNITVIVSRFDGDELIAPLEDERLAYRKFRYSASQDTTARRPVPPPVRDGSDTQPIPKLPEDEEAQTPPLPNIDFEEESDDTEKLSPAASLRKKKGGGIQRGIFIAASLALIVGIGLIFWSSTRGGKATKERGVVPIQTSEQAAGMNRVIADKVSGVDAVPAESAEDDDPPTLSVPSGDGVVSIKDNVAEEIDVAPAAGANLDEEGSESAQQANSKAAGTNRSQKSEKATAKTEEAVAVNTQSGKQSKKTSQKANRNRQVKRAQPDASTGKTQNRQAQKKGKDEAKKTESTRPAQAKPLDDNPF